MSSQLLTEKKYSVPQAAKLLGIGTTNAYALIHSGQLPAYKVGSKFVVLESDLEAYLQQAKYEPPKPNQPSRRTRKTSHVTLLPKKQYRFLRLDTPSKS